MVRVVEAVAALDAAAPVVGGGVAVADGQDLGCRDVVEELAADAAVRAHRRHVLVRNRLRRPEAPGVNAPVGQASTHSPQDTQVDRPMGSSMSNTILACSPRKARPITSLTCSSRQARRQRVHWMQASRFTAIAVWERSDLPDRASAKRGLPTFNFAAH